LILRDFLNCRRPGSHQAHISDKDVIELRKLIYAGFSKECSKPGYPGIICQLEHIPLHFIKLSEFLLPFLGIDSHGAKLPYLEYPTVLSYPVLFKKYRALTFELYKRC